MKETMTIAQLIDVLAKIGEETGDSGVPVYFEDAEITGASVTVNYDMDGTKVIYVALN